jgi:hypothetical protein
MSGEPDHLGMIPPRNPSKDPFLVANSTPLRSASLLGSLIVIFAFVVIGVIIVRFF